MAQNDSLPRSVLTPKQRVDVFERTVDKVTKQYYDPKFNGTDWPNLACRAKADITSLENPEAFESAMHDLLRKLGTSHTGFFHESARRIPSRLAIAATFHRVESDSGPEWVAEDVHSGGPAHAVGIRPYDVLLAIDGKLIQPPELPMFPMGADVSVSVRRDSQQLDLVVAIPNPRSRKQPHAQPDAVVVKKLPDNVGYLKVPILPGLLGLDVARSIDRAVAELNSCNALILDLRGHVGGGLGVLRLMSYLTPDKLPIGYTMTRNCTERGYDKTALPRLDRLPTDLPNPLAIASMAMRFVGRDPSVLLVSEGLGPKRWHGRIVILINEHTVSAGEMVAAFAFENGLATLIGRQTAGRLIPGSSIKVGHRYVLVIPKANYFTWNGNTFEGTAVKPDLETSWQSQPTRRDQDAELEAALRELSTTRRAG